jgi:hypothetical protein
MLYHDGIRLACKQCGEYVLDQDVFPLGASAPLKPLIPYLVAHIRQANELENRAPHLTNRWSEVAELHQHSTIPQRAMKFLRLVQVRTHEPGAYVGIEPSDHSLFDAVS